MVFLVLELHGKVLLEIGVDAVGNAFHVRTAEAVRHVIAFEILYRGKYRLLPEEVGIKSYKIISILVAIVGRLVAAQRFGHGR